MIDVTKNFQVIESNKKTPYQMSFQTAIWNIPNMLRVMRMGESPWQSEIEGTTRLQEQEDLRDLRACGTISVPIKYAPVYRTNKQRFQLDRLYGPDLLELRKKGSLKNGEHL